MKNYYAMLVKIDNTKEKKDKTELGKNRQSSLQLDQGHLLAYT